MSSSPQLTNPETPAAISRARAVRTWAVIELEGNELAFREALSACEATERALLPRLIHSAQALTQPAERSEDR